jgi:ankyrin repeat protein
MSVFESHRELSMISLGYILLSCFSDGPCLTEESFANRHTEYPFLDYAVRHWDTHTEECRGAEDVVSLVKDLFLSDTHTENYLSYAQARHGSAFGYDPDKSPLSCLTHGRLTWVLKCLYKTPPSWYNEELGRHGTPLANAVLRDDLEMITYLLDAGVDINKHCENWVRDDFPLYLAAGHCFPKSFDLLMDRGADPHQWRTVTRDSTMHEVCRQGHLAMAQKLVRRGVTANVRNRASETALHLAIRRCSLDVTRLLVEESDAEVLTRVGKTALHFAIEVRSAPITEYLLGRCNDIELSYLRNLSIEQIEWAAGEPWYARLYSAIAAGGERDRHYSRDLNGVDIIWVQAALQRRLGLPQTVTDMILEYAEYWSRSSVKRAEMVVVDMNSVQSPYISIPVVGRGKSPVRQIIFHTKSHDQGEFLIPNVT